MNLDSARIARKHVVTLAAVAALLAQAFFPHVHAWHARSTAPVRVAAADRCTVDCPTALHATTAADHGDADRHSSSTCPLCRAQSDARSSLLPPAFTVPLPAAGSTTRTDDAAFAVATTARSVAAPRAPPFAS